jgi:hypothetical protein
MSTDRLVLSLGLFIILVLFCIPLVFVIQIGQLDSDPVSAAGGALELPGPIADPAPPIGLAEPLILRLLLYSGIALGFALGSGVVVLLFRRRIASGTAISEKPTLWLLAIIGLVSLAIYSLCFLQPFPLQKYYSLKQISIGLIANRDPGVALGMSMAIVSLFLLYGLAYYLCRNRSNQRLWVVVLLSASLFAVVNFSVATITTLDPYDYITRGRIAGIHGGNPYLYPPEAYPHDPFVEYASWKHVTSAYGPMWESLSALFSQWTGHHLWPNMLVYKGLMLSSYLLCVLLIARILRRVAPERALAGTLLFAWNPLILLESIANGHNDTLMVVFLLAALGVLAWTSSNGGDALPLRAKELVGGGIALLLLAASILIKFVPVLLLPLFLLFLLAGQRGWWRRILLGLLLLIPIVLLVGAYYLPFWEWPGITDTFTRRSDMFRMSVPSLAVEVLMGRIDEGLARTQVGGVFVTLFVLSYLGVLLRTGWSLGWAWAPRLGSDLIERGGILASLGCFLAGFRAGPWERPWDILLRACYNVLILYLLLVSFWFMPWYLIWPIALLALFENERMVLLLAIAGCVSQLSHIAWNFTWYWWGISWETVYQMDALVVALMILPALLVYLASNITRLVRQKMSS